MILAVQQLTIKEKPALIQYKALSKLQASLVWKVSRSLKVQQTLGFNLTLKKISNGNSYFCYYKSNSSKILNICLPLRN